MLLLHLPSELIRQIALSLSLHDFCRLKATCKSFDTLVYRGSLYPQIQDQFDECIRLLQFDIALEILDHVRLDPSKERNRAVRLAARGGHLPLLSRLLQEPSVDPSDFHNHAILDASFNGHCKVVQMLLLDSRVDPTTYNNQAIRFATQRGHTEICRMLMKIESVKDTLREVKTLLYLHAQLKPSLLSLFNAFFDHQLN